MIQHWDSLNVSVDENAHVCVWLTEEKKCRREVEYTGEKWGDP